MSKAIEAGKSEKEIKALLDKYLEAQEKQRKIDEDAAEKYKKVLSTTKVAKLYIGEEKFRRQHIRKLRDMQGQKK
jgi:arginyl-tRNA--protein-N-Asp/Glu arginylyltransferase